MLIEMRTFRSKIARRMFAVYVSCSLIPILCFALYSYIQVRNQLEADAIGALGREAKNAGMSIYERLRIAESQLRTIARDWEEQSADLVANTTALSSVRRAEPEEIQLGSAQARKLREPGAVLLKFDIRSSKTRTLLYLNSSAGLLSGEVDLDFLFAPERRQLGERYWVENETGELLFEAADDAMTRSTVPPRAAREVRKPLDLEGPTGRELAIVWPLFLGVPFEASTIYIGLSRQVLQIHRPLHEFEQSFPIVVLLALLSAIALALRQIRRSWIPLDAMTEAAHAISQGTFTHVDLDSRDEFGDLAAAFNSMADEIRSQITALERLHEIGTALSREESVETLLDKIVQGAAILSGAQACALFMMEECEGNEHQFLNVARVWIGGATERSLANAKVNFPTSEARHAARSGEHVIADHVNQGEFSTKSEWDRFQQFEESTVRSLLAVPLQNSSGETLGALVVMRDSTQPKNLGNEELQLVQSLASQAAVGIRQARSVESLRGLFEGLIQLTVRAIDEKSAHTGDHCRKVPIITELVAEAAANVEHGPLKDFKLSAEERYELRIAALLHDCGKMVTPVHIMDKATKLEGIIDRLELIHLRAEIIRRDARHTGHENSHTSDAAFASTLDRDLAFIEECNIGGEFMSEDRKQMIREIGQRYRWLDSDGSVFSLLTDDEVLNLCISRGTLNDEEREVINGHVVTTIRLLEELPFPKEMRNVPGIAGSHHECVNGHGYPQSLQGEELSMQGRILCLADVFEALTAKDRPYKDGMSLSQSLSILQTMVDEGELDADLYQVFLEDKAYLKYAAKHMDANQIDAEHRDALEEFTAPWSL